MLSRYCNGSEKLLPRGMQSYSQQTSTCCLAKYPTGHSGLAHFTVEQSGLLFAVEVVETAVVVSGAVDVDGETEEGQQIRYPMGSVKHSL